MNILLEKSAFSLLQFIKLIDQLKQFYNVYTLNFFTIELLSKTPRPDIIFCTIDGIKLIQNKFSTWPTLTNWEQLKCSYYIPLIKEYTYSFGEDLYTYKNLAIDDNVFIRPDANDKSFTGKLTNINEIHKTDELCLISKPVDILHEWH